MPFFNKMFDSNSLLNEVDQTANSKETDELIFDFQKNAKKFMKKIGPKFKAATSNLKARLEELLTKGQSNDILKNHIINKRGTEPTYAADDIAKNSDIFMEDVHERRRKHISSGSTAQPNAPHQLPQTGQSQYYELVDGKSVSYVPDGRSLEEDVAYGAPRYVFDRFGHRYSEQNGKLKLIGPNRFENSDAPPPLLGSGYHGPSPIEPYNFNVLENILNNNQEVIDSTNSDDPNHMIEHPIDLTLDTLEFIKELSNKNSGKKYANSNMDYSTSYDESRDFKNYYESVGESQHPIGKSRPQRSFDIIPLVKDKQDGSVLVKIAPSRLKEKNNKKYSGPYLPKGKYNLSVRPTIISTSKINKPNNHDGVKTYEVITLENDSPVFNGKNSSDEDFEILRYVYESQNPTRKANIDKAPPVNQIHTATQKNSVTDVSEIKPNKATNSAVQNFDR